MTYNDMPDGRSLRLLPKYVRITGLLTYENNHVAKATKMGCRPQLAVGSVRMSAF